MRARDVTGLYAFFSARHWAIFSTFWVVFLLAHTENPGEIGNTPLEKIQKSSGEGTPKLQISVPSRGRTCPDTQTKENGYKHFDDTGSFPRK